MAHIPRETIEQIAAASDIVEVISPHVVLKRAGGTYKGLCPFHNEKTPSFTVNPHRQRFKCFGCGVGGNVFDFVKLYEHVEFGEAAKRLAGRAGIRIVEQELSAEDQARLSLRQRLLALHAETADWFHLQLVKTRAAQAARDYLKGRGINIEIARSWKLGYAPDSWEAFGTWAQSRGYSPEVLAQSGLVKVREGDSEGRETRRDPGFYDAFRNRVMFPICNDSGEVIAFSGRVLQADAKAAKYVNSPETVLFTKGSVLFGLHRSKRALIDKKSAIVCEGQLDLITAFESGVQNVIAPQGTAFTERQAHILKRFVEDVILCFDADAAGQKAAERSLGILLAENLAVRIVEMPAGEDPDSLIRGQGPAAFLERVNSAKDFFDFQLDRLSARSDFASPRVKADAARRFGAWIAQIPDPILREAVMGNVAQRLDIALSEFARLVRQPKPSAPRQADGETTSTPVPLDQTLRVLLKATLQNAEARAWMLAAPWRELFEQEPDSALVIKVLEGNPPFDNPPALNAFLTTLEPGESAAVCELLDEEPFKHALTTVQASWFEIARRQISRRIESAQIKLRVSGLAPEEVSRLQVEISSLRTRLEEIPRLLLPPS